MHLVMFGMVLFCVNIKGCLSQGITVKTNCFGTTYGIGRITSPDFPNHYENNQNCYWLLTANTGIISITFEQFATHGYDDFVRVYDGKSTRSPVIGHFSGYYFDPNNMKVNSSSSQMYITFTSNRLHTSRGFSLIYIYTGITVYANCPGTTDRSIYSGHITSPNYPSHYRNRQHCIWLLTSYSGDIDLSIQDFSIEKCCDFVRVYHGNSSSSPLVGRFSGNLYPNNSLINNSTTQVYITFISDWLRTYRGFWLYYRNRAGARTTKYPWTWPNSSTVDATTTMLPSTKNSQWTTSPTQGTIQYPWPNSSHWTTTPPQGITVQTNCDGTSNVTGRITSPNYPNYYYYYQNCYWLLTANTGIISITFESFDTQRWGDFVRVYDGNSTRSPVVGHFSGYYYHPNNMKVNSSSSQMYITFISRFSRRRGFSLKYNNNVSTTQLPTTAGARTTQFPWTWPNPSTGTTQYPWPNSSHWTTQTPQDLKVEVTCDTSYMEVELKTYYFSNVDWRNLHLNDPECRANLTSYGTIIRLRTTLGGCGTNCTEQRDMLVFENKVINDHSHDNQSYAIIRDSSTLLSFYCKYSRRQLVSTNFDASKETIQVSEGNFGNFTFSMHMYKSDEYKRMYVPYEYPVSVGLNQPLWIQFKVVNTIGDLVVFAENCRATTSADPNTYPSYKFLKNGCPLDKTIAYKYNPNSSIQRFSIKSFRFIHASSRLVYLHCELMVCHRNSTNSRCSRGCARSRRRRDAHDYDDTSGAYDLSTGPISGEKISSGGSGFDDKVQGVLIGLGVLGGVFVLLCVAAILKAISVAILKSRKVGSSPAPSVQAAFQSRPPPVHAVEAYDGPVAYQLDEISKAR